MKRVALIRELVNAGCFLKRHGSKHDVYMNPQSGRKASVPRHTELKNTLCDVIRKQLGIK